MHGFACAFPGKSERNKSNTNSDEVELPKQSGNSLPKEIEKSSWLWL